MKKIRFGILGCSNFLRKRIIDAFSKSEYGEIVCLSSRDLEKAKRWAEEFNIKNYDTYDNLLKKEDIDAIYISLPVGLHKEWAVKAANSGKHVLCEKSLAGNLDDVKEIIDSCKKNNVKLTENMMIKYHPQHAKVLSMIESGNLGKSFSFKSSFGIPKPNEDDIRYKRELGGGVLNDIVCYPIFMSRFLFKEEPISVFCSLNLDEKRLIDVSGSFLLEFPEDKKAMADFGYDKFYQNNYSVWGTKGFVKVNRAYSISEDILPDIDFISDHENKKIESQAANQYAKTIDEFCLDIMENRGSDFKEILNQAKIMEALRLSAKFGKKIMISDIEKEKFVKKLL